MAPSTSFSVQPAQGRLLQRADAPHQAVMGAQAGDVGVATVVCHMAIPGAFSPLLLARGRKDASTRGNAMSLPPVVLADQA